MVYEAYVDGSFKEYPGIGSFYSSAALIYPEGKKEDAIVLTKVSGDDLISMRNVAGELMAVMMTLEHCLNTLKLTQKDTIRIYYDYAGIENWTKSKTQVGYWRSKNVHTQAYRDYVTTKIRPTMKLEFVHVTGHSGVVGNEEVDKFAKAAMAEYVNKLRK